MVVAVVATQDLRTRLRPWRPNKPTTPLPRRPRTSKRHFQRANRHGKSAMQSVPFGNFRGRRHGNSIDPGGESGWRCVLLHVISPATGRAETYVGKDIFLVEARRSTGL